jgi:hypothetical protein
MVRNEEAAMKNAIRKNTYRKAGRKLAATLSTILGLSLLPNWAVAQSLSTKGVPTSNCAPPTAQSQQHAGNVSGAQGIFQQPVQAATLTATGSQLLNVQTGAEPGAKDPMAIPAGRRMLFADQGLGAITPKNARVETSFYQTKANLNLGEATLLRTQPLDPNNWGPPQIFATTGRILTADHDNLVTAVRTGNPRQLGTVAVSVDGTDSITLLQPLFARQGQQSDYIAIAQGDLDLAPDQNGERHNEVVIVHVSGQVSGYYEYSIDVLNYGSGKLNAPEITSTGFRVQPPTFNSRPDLGVKGVLPSDNIISLAIGDFYGTGHNEIRIAYLFGDSSVLIHSLQYETRKDGSHELTFTHSRNWDLTSIVPENNQKDLKVVGTVALAAGDFDGDGKDELALAYAKWGVDPRNTKYGDYAIGLLIFNHDSSGELALKSTNYSYYIGGLRNTEYYTDSLPQVQLVAGQFLLEPPQIPYGRKQLVMAWNDTGNVAGPSVSNPHVIAVVGIAVTKDLTRADKFGARYNVRLPGNQSVGRVFSLTAGGLRGFATDRLPRSFPAISASGNAGVNNVFRVETLDIDSTSGIRSANIDEFGTVGYDQRAKYPLVAYDRAGRSLYLGEPAHIQIFDAPTTDYVLQEPPKHTYWDDRNKQVVNMTRFEGNNVHLFNSNTSSLKTDVKTTVARSTGGSLEVSAGATAGVENSMVLLKASTQVAVDITVGACYDYNENVEDLESHYEQRTLSIQGQTDRDDFLTGAFQVYDIWRYRVYGQKDGQLNPFYEIVLPGRRIPFTGAGTDFAWYQPIHENGNILSYPAMLGPGADAYIPGDMGSYTLPNGQKLNTPQIPAHRQIFNGNSGSVDLSFSSDVSKVHGFTYSHQIGESYDSKTSVSAKFDSGFGYKNEFRVSGEIEFHNNDSWGGANTSNNVTQTQTAVTLNRIAGRSAYSYPFYPVFYNTKDGTLKMAFAVPNPASQSNTAGYQTFAGLYGGLSDPALNLPYRFQPVFAGSGELESWIANLGTERKQMRGLFFRHAEKNPVDKTYHLIGSSPLDGSIVRIEPRVYNYSTAEIVTNVTVEFQAIPYEPNKNSEICSSPLNAAAEKNTGLLCPASARTVLGRVNITKLAPLQFTCVDGIDDPAVTDCASPVYLNWNTRGFGPSLPGSVSYRVYVVLNPDTLGKNENYGMEAPPVSITNVEKNTTGTVVVTAPGHSFRQADYIMIGGVQGADRVNGIFRVASFSSNQFELAACQPAPPCVAAPQLGGNYTGGGVASAMNPGQNNEGYGLISIMTQSTVNANIQSVPPKDYLAASSLQAETEEGEGVLQQGTTTAYLGLPMELRFTAFSTEVHPDASQVLLFDGDPSRGAPAVLSTVIHPGGNGPDGDSVWFSWTPTKTGEHHLFAVLLRGARRSQEASELMVNVVTNPNSPETAARLQK